MKLNVPAIVPKPPSTMSVLYGVRYSLSGKEYAFRLEKICEKFKCIPQQVLDAITSFETTSHAPPDGPLKGIFIRRMGAAEQTSIKEEYKKKKDEETIRKLQLEAKEHVLELVIGSITPESIW